MSLHIVHGGVENGDKARLLRTAKNGGNAGSWIVPKSATPGDEMIIVVQGSLFATSKIKSRTRPRPDWGARRYGADLGTVRLIEPDLSLSIVRRRLPALTWAIYPRSITTPPAKVAKQLMALIRAPRAGRGHDVADDEINLANISELRAKAWREAKPVIESRRSEINRRIRSHAVHLYVLGRADGVCEGCGESAPFVTIRKTPYLEPHHVMMVAEDGPDAPDQVIALCPTCHRRVHHAHDGTVYNNRLKKKLKQIERSSGR